jgi:hypothetical protein
MVETTAGHCGVGFVFGCAVRPASAIGTTFPIDLRQMILKALAG